MTGGKEGGLTFITTTCQAVAEKDAWNSIAMKGRKRGTRVRVGSGMPQGTGRLRHLNLMLEPGARRSTAFPRYRVSAGSISPRGRGPARRGLRPTARWQR